MFLNRVHTDFEYAAATAKSLQSCPTLCDPIDGSLPGSSAHGVFHARVLEWGAITFSFEYATKYITHKMGIKIVLALWVVMRTELIIENKLGECQVLVQKVLASIIIGEGNGTPLQYSCLENPMDGGAW